MDRPTEEPKRWLTSRSGVVFLGFFAVAAFFVLMEHTAHVLGALPYLLLLACPLMHFFHGGHGHRHGGRGSDEHGRPR